MLYSCRITKQWLNGCVLDAEIYLHLIFNSSQMNNNHQLQRLSGAETVAEWALV